MGLPAQPPAEPWLFPVPGGYVTSEYERRFHPTAKTWRMHSGLDIGKGQGAIIVAPADGEIISRSDDVTTPEGRYLLFAHYDGWRTSYSHLLSSPHRRGDRVRRGELLAYMGNTGTATTGPHLHWTAFDLCGQRINPLYGLQGKYPRKDGGTIRGLYPAVNGTYVAAGLLVLGGLWWWSRRSRR